jgi:surfeit locus 1 family protein
LENKSDIERGSEPVPLLELPEN